MLVLGQSSNPVVMSNTKSTSSSSMNTSSSTTTTSTPASRSSSARVNKPQMQRNRSKGTIVAYGSSNGSESSSDKIESPYGAGGALTNASASSQLSIHTTNNASVVPQPPTENPCHAARLVLLCTQNALRLGARTQLLLCPPGKSRRELQAALRQRPRLTNTGNSATSVASGSSHAPQQGSASRRQSSLHQSYADGYYGLDKLLGPEALADYEAQEEAFLLQTSYSNISTDLSASNAMSESQEEEDASSGDEDELLTLSELFSTEPLELDDLDARYYNLEPLFISAATANEANAYGSHTRGAPIACSKLPFYRRKLRFFDMVSPQDRSIARAYLQKEFRRSKVRSTLLLTRHLRLMQLEAKRRQILGQQTGGERAVQDALMALESSAQLGSIATSVEAYPVPMTPAAAAALLLESLALNPLESVEGMAKCYEGIVAVGVALLDSQAVDPASLDSANKLRSQIMTALAPLLITSLEQPSGEVILQLAKLRRMSGTVRYQRRFVQRVAPLLIRPPRGALYCVRHQNDMEAILAAAELIFDSSFDVFSKGWYERGRLLLVDKKRAKTLQSAAQQLRDLVNTEPSDSLALGFPGHGGRRRPLTTATGRKSDGQKDSVLAEWEVMAVDHEIRASIASVMTLDWSRAAIHSDIPRPHNRRATVAASASKRLSVVPHASSLDSPKPIPSSPRSPPRSSGLHTPSTPPSLSSSHVMATSSEASIDGPVSPKSSSNRAGRSLSPPSQRLLHSPPPLQRARSHDDTKTPMTPPRSPIMTPKSPNKTPNMESTASTPLSPKRNKALTPTFPVLPAPPSTTPNSPSASSVGSDAHRASAAASGSYYGPSSVYNRTLTSSIAERKRTVAACRALRAQIHRFEEAFIQLHGRPPKGALERAPLATTYAQYKEWKRAIRTDAACRVQALFRGALIRTKLLRMKNPKITRVVLRKAGRVRDSESAFMNKIGLPMEIGQSDNSKPTTGFPMQKTSSVAASNVPPGQNLPWASKIVRRRNVADHGDALPTTGAASRPYSSPTPSSDIARSSSISSHASIPNIDGMTLPELQAQKRDLKQQLKQYDMNFARKHGRMPVKAEKEPIRHLYEAYNLLKSRITYLETEEPHTSDTAVVAPLSPLQASPVPPAPLPPPQRLSPTSGSEQSGSDESNAAKAAPIPTPRSRRKLPVVGSPPVASRAQPTSPAVQDLAALKTEKSQLHQMLRSYERDFFREHNRQVSSYQDIQPVANQYRRYKEIKKAIAALQQQMENSEGN